MRVAKAWVLMACAAVLPLTACGVDEQDEGLELPPASTEEDVSSAETADEGLGQVEQGLWTIGATCGHGTFAFAYCSKRNMGAPAIGVYGCKARTTGRIIWWKSEMCGTCADYGIRLGCGTEA